MRCREKECEGVATQDGRCDTCHERFIRNAGREQATLAEIGLSASFEDDVRRIKGLRKTEETSTRSDPGEFDGC